MTEREALKLAQKALSNRNAPPKTIYEALHAIKEALAQPEQEPVAVTLWEKGIGTTLNTTPPQRTWVGLTPQERDEINEQVYGAVPHHVAFHAAIEAKLKEKNT